MVNLLVKMLGMMEGTICRDIKRETNNYEMTIFTVLRKCKLALKMDRIWLSFAL